MVNVFSPIMEAWWDLLGSSLSVPVYTVEAPAKAPLKYVLIREESLVNEPNKAAFIKDPIIIIEIVTKFPAMVDYRVAHSIDNEINALLYNSPSSNNLNVTGFQLVGIDAGTQHILDEDDGTERIRRIVTRYVHKTIQ